jgi:glutamyl-tRNA synthetase
MKPAPARVRFAPSPTGRFHLGGARTALYDYLLARQTGGQLILRIEDTDRKRFDPRAEAEIMEGLRWLGLQWDEGPDIGGPCAPYRQSERAAIYQRSAQQLVDSGNAYYCFCTAERLAQVRQEQQRRKQPPRYDGLCRRLAPSAAAARATSGEPHVIRLKTPEIGTTTGIDLLRGEITVENANLDDYILRKSNGLPVYHLAAMVDDHEMGITHVLRGSEWLPTFPLHVLIYQALEWQQPIWVHLSVFLSPSGKGKMSKRSAVDAKGGAHSIFPLDMRQMGYLPEAINNWVALMGWSYDDHTELFSMNELIDAFSLEKLNPSPAAVNFAKLDHFNGVYIRALEPADLAERLLPFFQQAGFDADLEHLQAIVPLIRERITTLEDALQMAGFFFQPSVNPDPTELIGKDMTAAESSAAARQAYACMKQLESPDSEELEAALHAQAQALGLSAGQFFGILRVAITGQRVSPPLIETMELVGREQVLDRLQKAASLLDALSAA